MQKKIKLSVLILILLFGENQSCGMTNALSDSHEISASLFAPQSAETPSEKEETIVPQPDWFIEKEIDLVASTIKLEPKESTNLKVNQLIDLLTQIKNELISQTTSPILTPSTIIPPITSASSAPSVNTASSTASAASTAKTASTTSTKSTSSTTTTPKSSTSSSSTTTKTSTTQSVVAAATESAALERWFQNIEAGNYDYVRADGDRYPRLINTQKYGWSGLSMALYNAKKNKALIAQYLVSKGATINSSRDNAQLQSLKISLPVGQKTTSTTSTSRSSTTSSRTSTTSKSGTSSTAKPSTTTRSSSSTSSTSSAKTTSPSKTTSVTTAGSRPSTPVVSSRSSQKSSTKTSKPSSKNDSSSQEKTNTAGQESTSKKTSQSKKSSSSAVTNSKKPTSPVISPTQSAARKRRETRAVQIAESLTENVAPKKQSNPPGTIAPLPPVEMG